MASLLLGVGSHKNAFPELYPNDEKRRPIRFKYSLTLFVEGKGWILFVMFALLFVSVAEPFNPFFNFTIYLLRNQWRSTICWVVVWGICLFEVS
jgi:hypothetical protein